MWHRFSLHILMNCYFLPKLNRHKYYKQWRCKEKKSLGSSGQPIIIQIIIQRQEAQRNHYTLCVSNNPEQTDIDPDRLLPISKIKVAKTRRNGSKKHKFFSFRKTYNWRSQNNIAKVLKIMATKITKLNKLWFNENRGTNWLRKKGKKTYIRKTIASIFPCNIVVDIYNFSWQHKT